MYTYSLTHEIEQGDSYENVTIFGDATHEQINAFLMDQGDLAYQYYVMEWFHDDPGDDPAGYINEQTNGEEWVLEYNASPAGQ